MTAALSPPDDGAGDGPRPGFGASRPRRGLNHYTARAKPETRFCSITDRDPGRATGSDDRALRSRERPPVNPDRRIAVGAARPTRGARARLSRLDARRRWCEVRRDIGFIFQMHNLFDALSAYENVKMAAAARRCAGRRDAPARRRKSSSGWGSAIVSIIRPRSLSGGQRQRVAIGRALVNHPRLVLADEPTAALDKDSTMNVIKLLKEQTIEDGSAVVMVTHDHRIIELGGPPRAYGRRPDHVRCRLARRTADLRVPAADRYYSRR